MASSPDNYSDLEQRAMKAHKDAFGEEPVAVAAAPGSWSLVGEHTDPFGGVVLLSLTDVRTVAAITPREDNTIEVLVEEFDHHSGEFTTEKSSATLSDVAPRGEDKMESDFSTAEHVAGLVHTMMHRQMLSRDTAGFSVTVSSTIPRTAGIGADVALDVAVALAVGHGIDDLSAAPVRAKLADVCFQASHNYSAFPSVRARYTAALRGQGSGLNIVDYADGSITQASHPVGKSTKTTAFVVSAPAQGHIDGSGIAERHEFLENAAHAFGATSLRLLPDAPARVVDWLSAIHKVNGPEGVPSVAGASSWMNFLAAETNAATSAAQAIRSRRHMDLFPIINTSQEQMYSELGLVDGTDRALAQLCVARGARSARSAEAGASTSVVAIVDAAHAANFQADLAEDGLSVIELLPGQPAEVLS